MLLINNDPIIQLMGEGCNSYAVIKCIKVKLYFDNPQGIIKKNFTVGTDSKRNFDLANRNFIQKLGWIFFDEAVNNLITMRRIAEASK